MPTPPSPPGFVVSSLLLLFLVYQRNSLWARSGPHIRWGLVKSPSKCCAYWQFFTHRGHSQQPDGHVSHPGADHLDPKTLERLPYLHLGYILSPCFLRNPFRGLELARQDISLTLGMDYQSHLEFALHPYFRMDCEGDVGFLQITFSFVGQELKTCFGEAWQLWNFLSEPLLQKQETDGLLGLCWRAIVWHMVYLPPYCTKQSPRPSHCWGSWRHFLKVLK